MPALEKATDSVNQTAQKLLGSLGGFAGLIATPLKNNGKTIPQQTQKLARFGMNAITTTAFAGVFGFVAGMLSFKPENDGFLFRVGKSAFTGVALAGASMLIRAGGIL